MIGLKCKRTDDKTHKYARPDMHTYNAHNIFNQQCSFTLQYPLQQARTALAMNTLIVALLVISIIWIPTISGMTRSDTLLNFKYK